MLRYFLTTFFYILMIVSPLSLADTRENGSSIRGDWQTLDDKTHQPTSVIAIQLQGQYFVGKVVKIYEVNGAQKNDRCTACHGSQQNKPILGLQIIQKMQCTSDRCWGGTILDPRDGKIYKATLRLIKQGEWLKVRGYIGISLFGQTVYWRRTQL